MPTESDVDSDGAMGEQNYSAPRDPKKDVRSRQRSSTSSAHAGDQTERIECTINSIRGRGDRSYTNDYLGPPRQSTSSTLSCAIEYYHLSSSFGSGSQGARRERGVQLGKAAPPRGACGTQAAQRLAWSLGHERRDGVGVHNDEGGRRDGELRTPRRGGRADAPPIVVQCGSLATDEWAEAKREALYMVRVDGDQRE